MRSLWAVEQTSQRQFLGYLFRLSAGPIEPVGHTQHLKSFEPFCSRVQLSMHAVSRAANIGLLDVVHLLTGKQPGVAKNTAASSRPGSEMSNRGAESQNFARKAPSENLSPGLFVYVSRASWRDRHQRVHPSGSHSGCTSSSVLWAVSSSADLLTSRRRTNIYHDGKKNTTLL